MKNEDKYGRYANIPIPSYDEATSSSRPSLSQNLRGPGEVSDDAERQGLLPQEALPQPSAGQSTRSSEDSEDGDLRLPEVSSHSDDDRRRLEELDYLDPSSPDPAQRQSRLYHRARLRSKWSQHFSSIGATLSSIRFPSFRSLYAPIIAGAIPTDAPPPSRSTWLSRTALTLPTVPERYRMSAGTAARLVGLLTIALLIYILFILDIFPGTGRYMGARFDPESVRIYVQDNVNSGRIEEYMTHITSYDHVAGTEGDLFMAEWMKQRWQEEGNMDDIALLSYFVYLNYPTPDGRSVSIVKPEEKKWTANLEEDLVNPETQQTLAWHGSSRSGEVEGHLVYANGGSREDFTWLKEHGVVLNGSIALMRYYSTQGDRSLKVKAAEEAGCIGALIYSDPSDDGSGKGPVWPDGPWRTDDSLQRGSVAMSSFVIGDTLTPGYASTEDAARVSKENNPGLNQIPSLPLAWRDAVVLLKAIEGHGKRVPENWIGGSGKDGSKDGLSHWYSGSPGKDATIVHLKNINDENEKQQIWNLHGLIEGLEQPEKKVIVGNHRDAWCFGSVDPGSGSAVMMELVQIFGQLRELRWRPLRTIEFVSWDAEEYNLIGSTEYVEDNINYLRDNGVAYLNVDVGVYGPDPVFRAAGSPMWEKALLHVLDRVSTPGDNATTLRQVWDAHKSELEGLGAGSDYVAFQDMAGTSSIDFGFEGAANGYPYHSCYETLEWMKKFGDPDFNWHRVLAQVWALLILEVADRPILPFDVRSYASAIQGPYLDSLERLVDQHLKKPNTRRKRKDKHENPESTETLFTLKPLRDAADRLAQVAEDFHRFEDVWTANVLGAGGMENQLFARKRMQYNNKLAAFETDLLDLPSSPIDKAPHGLPGREQFKHIIFGPEAWSGYEGIFFPGIVDALERENTMEAMAMVEKVAAIVNRATDKLVA